MLASILPVLVVGAGNYGSYVAGVFGLFLGAGTIFAVGILPANNWYQPARRGRPACSGKGTASGVLHPAVCTVVRPATHATSRPRSRRPP